MVLRDAAVGQVPAGTPPPRRAGRRLPSRVPLSPKAAVLLAISFGICGGYLDVLFMLFRKFCWDQEGFVRTGRDFPWTVPVAHALLLAIPGAAIAAANWLRPRLVSLRAGSWILAVLAIWAALLRLPLYGACTLLLAAGLARPLSAAVARRAWHARTVCFTLSGLLGVLGVLAVLSSGRQAIREHLAVAGLPPAQPGARNVVLIVWDTVRAYNLSAYGYPRDTTPNLAQCARQGVLYHFAAAPAPWTYPSHSSFFTGQWPFKLNSQWKFPLGTPDPTLAEFLAGRGYQTAGFAANTTYCSYETGLDRGFAHFEDYPLSSRCLLGRTVPGTWILMHILFRGRFHLIKWIGLQSRGAHGTTEAFLGWLRERRPDRPFFAFLNYFDAHSPYIAPPGFEGRFGIRPEPPRDHNFLLSCMQMDARSILKRDIQLARDCYDNCIAFLDEQLGRLLEQLAQQKLLDNTVVIITSDHGEAFDEHGHLGHGRGVYLEEIGVPLVMFAAGAPAGRVVETPVSLRDLPATVVDLLGLSAGSPFPGRSLAAYWQRAPGKVAQGITSPVLSEHINATEFQPEPGSGRGPMRFRMSLLARGHHYIRDSMGTEVLYDLREDSFEQVNLAGTAQDNQAVGAFRKMLLDVLTDNPGSIEVEKAYLEDYKQRIRALIPDSSLRRVAAGH
jgi:arylsulfatase A-like enzyme